MDTARALFVQNGFHATGVAQIANVSGVAVGQIYRDFEAKEDLIAAIVEEDCLGLMSQIRDGQTVEWSHAADVWFWIRELLNPAPRRGLETLFSDIMAEAGRNPRIALIVSQAQDRIRYNLRAALAILVPDDALDSKRACIADCVFLQSLAMLHCNMLSNSFDVEALGSMAFDVFVSQVQWLQAQTRRAVE